MKATGFFYDGKLNYLAELKGDSTKYQYVYTGTHCQKACVNSKFSTRTYIKNDKSPANGGTVQALPNVDDSRPHSRPYLQLRACLPVVGYY